MKRESHNCLAITCLCYCLILIAGGYTTSAVAAGGGPISWGLETFVLSDDNIGRSELDADIQDDVSFNTVLTATHTSGVSFLSAISVTGTFQIEEFQDFDGLSNTKYGLVFDYRFQTRNGFTAPAYSLFLRVMELDFETDIRDSDLVQLGLNITRRITDRITGTTGLSATRRRADGEVFDLDRRRLFGNLDYRINRRWASYVTYSFIDGDVFSTASPSVRVISWAAAVEPDNAFGGIANDKFVYRLNAETQIFRFGVNHGLARNKSIDISADWLDSDAAGPNEYERFSLTASFLYRF